MFVAQLIFFDEDNLYDLLESNGLIDYIIAKMPESEYEFLYAKYSDAIKNKRAKFKW